MKIKSRSYPRAALIGNPSDGYSGKTIAFTFSNFFAEVTLEHAAAITFLPSIRDTRTFADLRSFHSIVKQFGYDGGVRLLMATLKKFMDFARWKEVDMGKPNFSLSYYTSIPEQVGFAGSSAIITACMKALCKYYEFEIRKSDLANLVLSVETEELGITAGLQDRVAQVFEKPVYMDFNKKFMDENGHGRYIPFSAELLPDLYIAYLPKLSEHSGKVHSDLRTKFEKGDKHVLKAMLRFAELSDSFYRDMELGETDDIASLMNENFDLRSKIMEVSEGNKQMVKLVRSVGASAKLTGSGGAIIGTYKNEKMLKALISKMDTLDAIVFQPDILNDGNKKPNQ